VKAIQRLVFGRILAHLSAVKEKTPENQYLQGFLVDYRFEPLARRSQPSAQRS